MQFQATANRPTDQRSALRPYHTSLSLSLSLRALSPCNVPCTKVSVKNGKRSERECARTRGTRALPCQARFHVTRTECHSDCHLCTQSNYLVISAVLHGLILARTHACVDHTKRQVFLLWSAICSAQMRHNSKRCVPTSAHIRAADFFCSWT